MSERYYPGARPQQAGAGGNWPQSIPSSWVQCTFPFSRKATVKSISGPFQLPHHNTQNGIGAVGFGDGDVVVAGIGRVEDPMVGGLAQAFDGMFRCQVAGNA